MALLSRAYWMIAVVIFFALEFLAPVDRVRVFSFMLKIPLIAENVQLQRCLGIFGEFIAATLAAYLSYFTVRLIRKTATFRPFWSALLVILGALAFARPFLVKMDAAWATEIIRLVLMVIALWGIYRLDLTSAFGVWALGYMVLVVPLLFVQEIPGFGGSKSSKNTSVRAEIESLKTSLHGTKHNLMSRAKLQDVIKKQLIEAEKGSAEAQYDLAMIYLDYGTGTEGPPEQALQEAFKWMVQASSQGYIDAQVGLANLYLEGAGIPVTPTLAAELYRKAADKGNLDAEARLGWLYAHALGVDWNGETALKHYTTAANGGSAIGLWGLGDMYISGNGTPPNPELGKSYYLQAAEKDYAQAQNELGWLTLAGSTNTAVSGKGIAYIQQAAKAEVAQALYRMMMFNAEGLGMPALPTRVLWWGDRLSPSAQAGHADSQWYWGRVHAEGLLGKADPNQAWTWISQSAYKGYADALDLQGDFLAYGLAGRRDPAAALLSYQTAAQFNAHSIVELIIRFRNGMGVPRDKSRVDYYLNHLRQMASRGDALSAYYLGDIYRNGIFLPQNYAQGLIWYKRAAAIGLGQAFYRIAEMTESGEGTKKEASIAYQNYRRAAALLYLPAFYNIAVGTAEGIGTLKNPLESKEWFLRIQRGAARGNPAHQLNLARLRERGLFGPRDEVAAAAQYKIAALHNDVDAARTLAKMILDGRGVSKDRILAYCWWDLAAGRGDGRSKTLRDALLKSLSASEKLEARKRSSSFNPETPAPK